MSEWIYDRKPTTEDGRWCRYGGTQVIINDGEGRWVSIEPNHLERWPSTFYPWRTPTKEDLDKRYEENKILSEKHTMEKVININDKVRVNRKTFEKLKLFVRDIHSNWFCDTDANEAHNYMCRACEAAELLRELNGEDIT